MTRLTSPLIALLLLVTMSAQAQIDRTKKPAAGPAPKVAFPEYYETTLDNGLKVFIVTNNAQPLVTFRLQIKSGAAFEQKSGIASFTTDLLTKGTTTRNSLAFAKEADNLGISIGAGSGDDAMSVSGSGLKKHTAKILEMMTDALYNPVFPADELEKARKQTLSSLTSDKKDPDAISGRLRAVVGFNVHPYAHFVTEESVKSITRDDLVAFHKAHFIPNNSSLAIVGDVTPKEILPVIKKYFDNWKKAEAPKSDFPQPRPITSRSVHIVDLGATQTQTSLGVMTSCIARNHPDFTTLSIANSILGGSMSGRLFQNLREKHGFTYGAYSSPDAYREAGVWNASSDVRRAATDSAVTEILGEMKRLQTEPVSDTELDAQKQYAVGRYLLSLENPGTTAQRVQDIDLYGLPKDYYKTYASRVMQINAGDIQQVARKYFSTENVAITAVGDASVIKAPLEKFGPVSMYDTDMKPVKAMSMEKPDIDAETLIRKHIDAVGGAAKLGAIKDRTTEYSLSMQFGPQTIDGTLTTIEKVPNMRYEHNVFMVDMGAGPQAMEQEEWVDGTSASATMPMQPAPHEYTGDDLARKLDDTQFNALLRWKELGYTPTVTSKRELDGKVVYVLDLKKKFKTTTLYFDAATFMLVGEDRTESAGGREAQVSVRYSAYEPVDGLMIAHHMTVDAGRTKMDAKVVKILQNTGVDDATFKRK